MPDAIVEKLWKIVDCRDQSLNAVHESQVTQAVEKEREIDRMAFSLVEKEQEIARLASALSDREDEILRKEEEILRKEEEILRKEEEILRKEEEILRKEVEIRRLAAAASERLELIDRQHAELESIGRSSEYRLGWAMLHMAGSQETALWQHEFSMNRILRKPPRNALELAIRLSCGLQVFQLPARLRWLGCYTLN